MPPSGKRRPTFGGQLLGANLSSVPAALPDDDEAQDEPAAAAAIPDEPQPAEPTPPATPPAPASTPTGSRERPPGTVRLSDTAARQLWDAYVAAKQADPFLTYRHFASAVVLGGLPPQPPS